MLKAYKFRLYPNNEQQVYLAKTFGCTRFVYNQILAERKLIYEQYKDNKEELKKQKLPTPAKYKKEFEWLKEVDSLALANAQMNLQRAYANFFRDNSIGFPKFKSKRNNNKAYTTNNQISKSIPNGTVFIKDNKIKIPKLKSMINIKQHREFTGLIKSCTVSQVSSGKYFISILVDAENIQLSKIDTKIGIDLGIKEFAITSDGNLFHNPKHLKKSEKRLAELQKNLSRKQKGSNNRIKSRLKVAKIHEKIANQRKDFLHKVSTQLINENQVIVIEDLKVSNMIKNHKLAKSIADVSWFEFRRMLEYKAEWYGREIIIAPVRYASSQLCSKCGNKSSQTKDLSCRTYICPVCGMIMDRDINASKNLLKLAM
ncbi:IS200/IS605 family element transposase accessory protein TnpB [Clostridium sp. CM027]|uniref:IS200/IS605 family element RNA-guided endonuclease TnpB n=1 Tax=Clostridium sp. CM027 TaxID=2849865 RepID=UPI001C6F0BBD|nr:IS200/IS605 family element RNA-guided endonuclease TnpB [Clostridium sp. CM027]MBW9146989.1 IS200/IS605 family element transposase accessory protein TnpB [Clostridium sp. CM027]UVE41904.1 IS200/IS605 family element transposase accessory protein TnpB [Clostridium sp. CM027]